jgi:hypothetical protein
MAQVGMFDGIEEIAAPAVSVFLVGQVAERKKNASAVSCDPEQRKRNGLAFYLKVDLTKTLKAK